MSKKDIVIIISGLIVLAGIILISYFLPGKVSEEEIIVLTDKQEYSPGDILKVKIDNNTKDEFCFSNCYPYYIEKEDENWVAYKYEECPQEDTVDSCVEPNRVKAFELEVPFAEEGFHRLKIQACVGCKTAELFIKNKELFSNQFIIR